MNKQEALWRIMMQRPLLKKRLDVRLAADVRFGSRLCKNPDIEVRIAYPASLCPDRLHQITNAQNADYSFHIVGQHV